MGKKQNKLRLVNAQNKEPHKSWIVYYNTISTGGKFVQHVRFSEPPPYSNTSNEPKKCVEFRR